LLRKIREELIAESGRFDVVREETGWDTKMFRDISDEKTQQKKSKLYCQTSTSRACNPVGGYLER
ncbi:MAG: hypothetical protein L6R42_000255, partial [Xanthoria sp. 1 TBL-2021]